MWHYILGNGHSATDSPVRIQITYKVNTKVLFLALESKNQAYDLRAGLHGNLIIQTRGKKNDETMRTSSHERLMKEIPKEYKTKVKQSHTARCRNIRFQGHTRNQKHFQPVPTGKVTRHPNLGGTVQLLDP